MAGTTTKMPASAPPRANAMVPIAIAAVPRASDAATASIILCIERLEFNFLIACLGQANAAAPDKTTDLRDLFLSGLLNPRSRRRDLERSVGAGPPGIEQANALSLGMCPFGAASWRRIPPKPRVTTGSNSSNERN
jgi:hypothetical protein